MAKKRKPVTHVVVSNVNGGYRLECLHCKTTYDPALPIPLTMFVAMMDSFGAEHEQCHAPASVRNSAAESSPGKVEE